MKSKKLPQELQLIPFVEWLNKQVYTYASDSETGLKLQVTLKGNLFITQNDMVKYQTLQPFTAIEEYNKLLNPEA